MNSFFNMAIFLGLAGLKMLIEESVVAGTG
jgi:hypothetical protein